MSDTSSGKGASNQWTLILGIAFLAALTPVNTSTICPSSPQKKVSVPHGLCVEDVDSIEKLTDTVVVCDIISSLPVLYSFPYAISVPSLYISYSFCSPPLPTCCLPLFSHPPPHPSSPTPLLTLLLTPLLPPLIFLTSFFSTVQELVDHPYETKSDSFYFVDNKLVMHNKADYAYIATSS